MDGLTELPTDMLRGMLDERRAAQRNLRSEMDQLEAVLSKRAARDNAARKLRRLKLTPAEKAALAEVAK